MAADKVIRPVAPARGAEVVVSDSVPPQAHRFSGFADLYDANRPSPPLELGALLRSYGCVSHPVVVDLGSGTGLSSRWAAEWAQSVTGIEPSADMRRRAADRGGHTITYLPGTSDRTGLSDRCADVVLAVQAMHWMDPTATHREVARILRPGGVFATVDADWPPVSGVVEAEAAWAVVHKRIRVFEARLAVGADQAELRRPIDDADPALVDEDLADPHRNRAMPGGVRSWSKSEHLTRMKTSGLFSFARELVFDAPVHGESSAERFVALLRSQGSYQALAKAGLTDAEIGADTFERDAYGGFAAAGAQGREPRISFSWRVRLGVVD